MKSVRPMTPSYAPVVSRMLSRAGLNATVTGSHRQVRVVAPASQAGRVRDLLNTKGFAFSVTAQVQIGPNAKVEKRQALFIINARITD